MSSVGTVDETKKGDKISDEDIEKNTVIGITEQYNIQIEENSGILSRLAAWGVEVRGLDPVPIEKRTDTKALNIFSFWWTVSLGILP